MLNRTLSATNSSRNLRARTIARQANVLNVAVLTSTIRPALSQGDSMFVSFGKGGFRPASMPMHGSKSKPCYPGSSRDSWQPPISGSRPGSQGSPLHAEAPPAWREVVETSPGGSDRRHAQASLAHALDSCPSRGICLDASVFRLGRAALAG